MVPFLPALIQMARWLMPGLKLEQSGPFLELAAKHGQPSEHALPSEILSLGLKMFGRGLVTQLVYQTRTNWKWPYWLTRQSDPADPAFQAVAHLIINQNRIFRNWTILGLPNHTERLVVDSAMMITPKRDAWSLEFWIQEADQLRPVFSGEWNRADYISNKFPLIRRQVVTDRGIGIRQNVFVSTIAGIDFGFTRLKIKNTTGRMQHVKIWVAIRPYNPEGISPINAVRFDEERNLWFVNNQPGMVSPDKPAVVLCGSDSAGDVWNMPLKKRNILKDSCPMGLCTAASVYNMMIPSNDIENLDFAFPLSDSPALDSFDWEDRDFFSYNRAKNRFYYRWNRQWDQSLSISIPPPDLNALTATAISNQSLFVQGNQLIPGYLIYQDFWFRDAAFLGSVLLKSGQTDPVRELLLKAPERQKLDGFFESQEGEWDSNGQLLWLAGQYWRYTRDQETIRKIWPNLMNGARWIQRKRSQNNQDAEVNGFLPAGFSAEHFGANDFYYWDNFWSIAGLRELINFARSTGIGSQVTWMEKELSAYEDLIFKSVRMVARDSNGALPASPKRSFDAGAIGVIAAVYPLQIMDHNHPVMRETFRHLQQQFSINHLFYHPVAHTGINIYLTLQLFRHKLYQRNPVIWRDLKAVYNASSPTFTWPEAFHPVLKGGVMGEGHHGWANAEWVSLVRDCLVCDWQWELWVTPVLNPTWFFGEDRVRLKNTLTPFGRVSFNLEWTDTSIRFEWTFEFHEQPAAIRWFLPVSLIQTLVEPGRFTDGEMSLTEESGLINLRRWPQNQLSSSSSITDELSEPAV